MSDIVLGLLVVVALALGWLALRSQRDKPDGSTERYRLSFEEAPIGMAILKPSGEFLEVNKSMARMLAYDQERLVGTNLTNLVHGDDQVDLGRAWEEMGNGNDHTATAWMRWLTARGRPMWSRISLTLVPWTPDQPAMVVLQIEDGSSTYEEQRVLQSLLHGKDEFVATVGGEMRDTLGMLIDLTRHPAEIHNTIRDIEGRAREIASILDDLVISASIARTPVSIVPEHLSPDVLCRQVLARLPVSGDVDYRPNATSVWADPALTRQILNGLLYNAIRYGGTDVELTTSGSGPDTVFRVTDNGPEIPEPDRERIFHGDLRGGQPATSPAAVGLSLSVGRYLARSMDGDLEYARTPQGTNQFELRLPSEQVSEAPLRGAAARLPA